MNAGFASYSPFLKLQPTAASFHLFPNSSDFSLYSVHMATSGYVFDIRHYSVHDGPGIRTSVFMKGCPLRCDWCHNPESQLMLPIEVIKEKKIGDKLLKLPETIGKLMLPADVQEEILKSRLFFEESKGGVTFTGGEPLMQPDFLSDCLNLAHRSNIHIALDTCGFAQPQTFNRIIAQTDLVLFDLKHTDSLMHKKFTGAALEPILINLQSEVLAQKPLFVRIPLIPGFNMTLETYHEMAKVLKRLKNLKQVDLLPYHRIASHKYTRLGMQNKMAEINEPKEKEVNEAVSFFMHEGFKTTVGG